MRAVAAFLLAICLAFLAPAASAADTPTFEHEQVARDADQYEAFILKSWAGRKGTVDAFLKEGDGLLAKDPRAASRAYAAATGLDAKRPRAWLGLAKSLIGMAAGEVTGQERYNIPVNASGAAYRAYKLATTDAFRAEALAVLATALEQRSFWRPAIEALKVSVALKPDAQARAALDRLKSAHGFRMTDYTTDADASEPRLCLTFSEALSKSTTDFSPYISIDGKDPQSLAAEESQLCLEGLEHGKRYQINVKAGLPSEIGEALEKASEIAVYVPDRKPMVRFSGRAYVLPSRGQQGIPVVSVNTEEVAVSVHRIGDRSLASAVLDGEIDRQLSTWDVETLSERRGEKVYDGILAVKSVLNAEVTTAFPVSEAIGTLKPGAYIMTAKSAKPAARDEYQVATQWFVVSDLGLTAFTGADGIDAFVRSLADAKPAGGAEVRLLARNNEVLATATTDGRGHVRFAGALTRGEGGMTPALLVAQGSATDYAFLDLSASAFDLTDRGVKGREPAGPVDGYVYSERGVYRPGEDVHLTALVRDAAGRASGVPVTLILSRPDGVEHQRTALTDTAAGQGLGGRSLTVPLSGGAMTGTWKAKLHVDPDDDPIAQVAFLVEDFVPERLDMTLTPAVPAITVGETAEIAIAGRFLYGPPAAELATEAEVVVRPAPAGLAAYPGFKFGQHDETVSPVREPIEETPETDQAGKASLEVALPQIPETNVPLEAQVIVKLVEPGGRAIERSVVLAIATGKPRIGIKPAFKADAIGEGETAELAVMMLGADGKPMAQKGLAYALKRLDTRWQWYSRDG
ncbi:MAG: MG2 domain-containing protein, partial [Hyphomicrobiaceae bacterium]|nr:MG2 domain-containing protein [Hyphomicrobiaceae bacterium]